MSYSENLLDMKLPGRGWGESITPMQALMVVRCLQPDQVIPAVTVSKSSALSTQNTQIVHLLKFRWLEIVILIYSERLNVHV